MDAMTTDIKYAEIEQKCTPQQIADRDLQAISNTVSLGRVAVQEYWLTDRGLVSDLMLATGTLAMSDAILKKFDELASFSPSITAVVNRLRNDARGINWGDGPLRAQIAALTPEVFTTIERDALLALAMRPAPVSVFDVQRAMEGH